MDILSSELYEKDLEIKKVELNFRNLQIRPHFFINCAMISGMAQLNDTNEIKKVLVYLADYFRYIMHFLTINGCTFHRLHIVSSMHSRNEN